MRRQPKPSPAAIRGRYAGVIALGAAVFVVDTFTTIGSAVAVLYVLALILVADVASRRALVVAAAISIGLTILAFVVVHHADLRIEPLLRLFFSLAAIIATALVLLNRHDERQTVEEQADLLDVTSDAIVLADRSGRVVYWNKGAEELYGWSFDEAWGEDHHALLTTRFPEPRAAIVAAVDRLGAWEGELSQRSRDGRTVHVFSRWRRRDRDDGRGGSVLESSTDVTARKLATDALALSEQRYRTIFETLAVAIWEHDLRPLKEAIDAIGARGSDELALYLGHHPEVCRALRRMVRVTDVNGTALKLMGVENKASFFASLDEFLVDPEDDFVRFVVAMQEGARTYQSETSVRTRSGEIRRVIAAFNFPPDGSLDRVQASILDVTERRRVEAALEQTRGQLDHALRAATIGEVSATIAHEINQPLAAISAYAAAAQRWMSRDPPDLGEVRAALDEAAAAAHRASQVVRRVRSFVTKIEPEFTAVAVVQIIEEALSLLRNDIANQGVVVVQALGGGDTVVRGDRLLLQQVLLNLMTNAMQAMQAAGSAVRQLSVRSFPRGEGIAVEIGDTGPGFTPEAAQKAFEPFFTTKAAGMGLGLAMCRTIVLAHGGEIAIAEASGRGGCVSLWLPCAGEG